jgi:hypothetical protein
MNMFKNKKGLVALISMALIAVVVAPIAIMAYTPVVGYPDLRLGEFTGRIKVKQYNQDGTGTTSNDTLVYAELFVTSQTDGSIENATIGLWRKQDSLEGPSWFTVDLWGYIGSNVTAKAPYVTLVGNGTDGAVFMKCKVKVGRTGIQYLSGTINVMIPAIPEGQDRWISGNVKLRWSAIL